MTVLTQLSYGERRQAAAAIRNASPAVAEAVTNEFFLRYPDWLDRYGQAGVERGIEDARFHIDFLAGAIETGNERSFTDYLEWAARVLMARNIQTRFLIENVEQVRDALPAHVSAADAALARGVVDASLAAFNETSALGIDPVTDAAREVYLAAALSGQRGAALNIAHEALREGMAVPDVYCDLLQPSQYQIGKLWETNRISVAQEHLATAVTQYVVAQLYSRLPRPETMRGNLVVSGVEGELHQLGAHMLADVLEAEGWDVRFLGTQLPHKDIIGFVVEHAADVLAISVTMLFNVPKAARLIDAVRVHRRNIRIVVGGSAFRMNDRLWHEIGADGSAPDLRSAVALINNLA